MNNKYFDHILGTQIDNISLEEKKITKRIIDAYIKEQPIEQIRENQRIGIKIQMKSYLIDETNKVVLTGEFLNELLKVYQIKKSQFAEYIGYENANLHALLKGRRKFNSKLASIIGKIFDIKPEIWLYIEAKNEMKSFVSNNKINLNKININDLSHVR